MPFGVKLSPSKALSAGVTSRVAWRPSVWLWARRARRSLTCWGVRPCSTFLSDDSMAWSSWSASVSVILSAGSAGSSDCVGSAGSINVVRRSDRRVDSPVLLLWHGLNTNGSRGSFLSSASDVVGVGGVIFGSLASEIKREICAILESLASEKEVRNFVNRSSARLSESRIVSRVRTRVRRPLVLTAIDEDSTLKKEGKRDRICSASESTLVRTTQGLDNQHVMAIITCPGLSSATVACTSSQPPPPNLDYRAAMIVRFSPSG